ncbi:MAG TPA: PH domain-containing protein [Gaiellaceae bacterium]|nr:PH domain-containing protein [Gaiellaceae bacterium]
MSDADGWNRLHPLSPVVRGGRATIAIAILFLPTVFGGGRDQTRTLVDLVVVAVLVALGFVSWIVTRWRVNGDDLQIETGVLRRQSLRFPLSQVQAIDVVRPGLARLFRVAELRLRMGGASGKSARLAYLHEREVEPLRDRLLALARGAPVGEASPPVVEHHLLATVPTSRLVASILVSDVGIAAELVLLGLVLGIVYAPSAAAGIASGGAVWILSVFQLVWRRFNQEYRLSVAEVPDGLLLRGGLVALTSETIRPGRVQAVRLVEPMAWRLLGWCRLEVDIAGRQRSEGEGQAQRRALRTILPVGTPALAGELLDHLLPERPRELSPPPRRVRWKSPLRYPLLGWGRTPTCVVTRSGRLRRATNWVPLEKVQSLRRVEGPVQRRLRLASVHVDTAGRSVHAVIRDRDVGEADAVLEELVASARAARKAA